MEINANPVGASTTALLWPLPPLRLKYPINYLHVFLEGRKNIQARFQRGCGAVAPVSCIDESAHALLQLSEHAARSVVLSTSFLDDTKKIVPQKFYQGAQIQMEAQARRTILNLSRLFYAEHKGVFSWLEAQTPRRRASLTRIVGPRMPVLGLTERKMGSECLHSELWGIICVSLEIAVTLRLFCAAHSHALASEVSWPWADSDNAKDQGETVEFHEALKKRAHTVMGTLSHNLILAHVWAMREAPPVYTWLGQLEALSMASVGDLACLQHDLQLAQQRVFAMETWQDLTLDLAHRLVTSERNYT